MDELLDAVGEYLEAYETAKPWRNRTEWNLPAAERERREKVLDRLGRARTLLRMQYELATCRRLKSASVK